MKFPFLKWTWRFRANGFKMSDDILKDQIKITPGSNLTIADLRTLPELNFSTYSYIVKELADDIEKKTGILSIIPIIQSAHESRNGNSGLARNHGNLFGIVATDSWKSKGKQIALMPTWESINGHRVDMKREFRAYGSWRESFDDWAGLITGLSIYKNSYKLLKQKDTLREGIREMGIIYATDPAYAKKLLAMYDLVKS